MFVKEKQDGGYPKESINHKDHRDHNKPGFYVRAVKQGYYGVAMREPGDVFEIKFARLFADHKDKSLNGLGWMEKVEGPNAKRRKSAEGHVGGARPEPEDPSEREHRMAEVDKMVKECEEAEVI